MKNEKRHILLCGNRRSGRSSMIRRLLEDTAMPAGGFMTRTLNTRADGYHEIYMFPYGEPDPRPFEHCHIGDCNTRERVIHNEVFNGLGVQLLCADTDGILVMDEIGFMESGAEDFCAAVLECLNGDQPVLAALRTSIDTPFIRQVLACEKARIVEMHPERFEEIYRELAPVVAGWERELRSC